VSQGACRDKSPTRFGRLEIFSPPNTPKTPKQKETKRNKIFTAETGNTLKKSQSFSGFPVSAVKAFYLFFL
jgi:hypothetical protein